MGFDYLFADKDLAYPPAKISYYIIQDIQIIVQSMIKEIDNIDLSLKTPYDDTFNEFFGGNDQPIDREVFIKLIKDDEFKSFIEKFSLGTLKSERVQDVFKHSFKNYEKMISDDRLIEKSKDMIEFLHLYRFNKKDPEKVMLLLTKLYEKKYGEGFLQRNRTLYWIIERKIEQLASKYFIDKTIVNLVKQKSYPIIDYMVCFYWFYAASEIDEMVSYLNKENLLPFVRNYVIELLVQKASLKSNVLKVQQSIKQSRIFLAGVIKKIKAKEISSDFIPSYLLEKIINLIK